MTILNNQLNISIDEESNMIDRFSLKIQELESNYGEIENVLHWSNAEITHYYKINNPNYQLRLKVQIHLAQCRNQFPGT